jgi:hypothetical protein
MTPDHLCAAIRTALLARGYELSRVELASTSERQWKSGQELCQEIMSEIADKCDLESVRQGHPRLWKRFPLITNLGYELADFFGTLLAVEPQGLVAARLLAAGFNLAIVVIDHMVDEGGSGDRFFRLVNTDVIREIFYPPIDTKEFTLPQGVTASEQLALALIAWCAAKGRALLVQTKTQEAWNDLAGTLAKLLHAEYQLSKLRWPTSKEANDAITALEAKSTLPTIVCLHIARLAGRSTEDYALALKSAKALAALTWRLDDLVDLIDDCRDGRASATISRMEESKATGESLTDLDIYQEIERTTSEILELRRLSPEYSSSIATRFNRLTDSLIAGWTRWQGIEAGGERAVAEKKTSAVEAGVEFLLKEQSGGYVEAKHHLHFPRLDFSAGYETHPALLSNRAVILDSLLDANEAGLAVPRRVLADEVMAILKSKHPFVRGGWNYIQGVPELPPDADDLGQVLQELVRFGGRDLASICEDSLRLLLDSSEESGGFCTWILDPNGNSIHHARIKAYLNVMGGWGVHPEVVANLLYGLLLYDPERYRAALHKGTEYLERAQNADGSWSSKWYRGAFYGTWRALSVLRPISPASPALNGAGDFLLSSQWAEGGWGERNPEPLSTALALLALCVSDTQHAEHSIERGRKFLGATQGVDGSWDSCEWIAFPTIDGEVVYGSRSVTTAFCIKALAASQARDRSSQSVMDLQFSQA